MTAAARAIRESNILNGNITPVPAIDVFRERCEARAILVEACALDLHEAGDGLQEAAVATGLVDEIGQDAVQAIMAKAFAQVPRAGELEDAIASIADCLETMPRPRDGIARSTLIAAKCLVQKNDPARLKAWLAKHTRVERIAIIKHIRGEKR
jgi:hypothetical protein